MSVKYFFGSPLVSPVVDSGSRAAHATPGYAPPTAATRMGIVAGTLASKMLQGDCTASDQLTVSDAGLPAGASSFTLHLIYNGTSGAIYTSIGTQDGVQGDGYSFGVDYATGAIAIQFPDGSAFLGVTDLRDGSDHRLIVRYDGSRVDLIVDPTASATNVEATNPIAMSVMLSGSFSMMNQYSCRDTSRFGMFGMWGAAWSDVQVKVSSDGTLPAGALSLFTLSEQALASTDWNSSLSLYADSVASAPARSDLASGDTLCVGGVVAPTVPVNPSITLSTFQVALYRGADLDASLTAGVTASVVTFTNPTSGLGSVWGGIAGSGTFAPGRNAGSVTTGTFNYMGSGNSGFVATATLLTGTTNDYAGTISLGTLSAATNYGAIGAAIFATNTMNNNSGTMASVLFEDGSGLTGMLPAVMTFAPNANGLLSGVSIEGATLTIPAGATLSIDDTVGANTIDSLTINGGGTLMLETGALATNSDFSAALTVNGFSVRSSGGPVKSRTIGGI